MFKDATTSGARLGTIPRTCESVDISTAAALALASAASATGEQLIEFGQVQRAILGISYLERAPTESDSERGGLPLVKEGIVVLEVPKGSPGAEAGLQAVQKPATPQGKPTIGDVIVGMNGDKIVDPATLSTVLSKYKPGTTVDLKVLRGPEQVAKTLKVKLGAFQGGSFSKLENERGPDFASKGTPINVPLSDIAPAITPKMPAAN